MYDNGRQLNRHAAKMLTKQKLRRRYLDSMFGFGRGQSWDDYASHCDDKRWLRYWRTWYFSGSRNFARVCTNSRLRSEFRRELAAEDFDNMYAPQGGNYRKHFDYWWTVL